MPKLPEKRKRIGIVGKISGNTFGVSARYMTFAAYFGDVYVLTPDMPILELDLLILPGGADISPSSYKERPGYELSYQDPYLEYFDKEILPHYIDNGTPIFGICRGMQAINVYFGGSLKQDIPNHPTSSEGMRAELVHKVGNAAGKLKTFEVNSLHHQAIDILGNDIVPTLEEFTEKDEPTAVIESITHKHLPIIGVQWHPEEIWDEYSIACIKQLLQIKESEDGASK